jgi:hypothetical protein
MNDDLFTKWTMVFALGTETGIEVAEKNFDNFSQAPVAHARTPST